MSTLFVSDVHLSEKNPKLTDLFFYFLKNKAILSRSLYILGDLFETWVGDDNITYISKELANITNYLADNGTSCYFIKGNRDFLIGKSYFKSSKITLLPYKKIININKQSIIILHGDTLCLNDKNYQKFKKLVNQDWLQKFFLKLPLCARIKISNLIINKRKKLNLKRMNYLTKINKEYIKKIMEQTNTNIMIHGHIHMPKVHVLPNRKYRIVLGMWNKSGSILEINKKLSLIKFSKLYCSYTSYPLKY
ncbi:ybbF [Wigglesworthia glossinidia endosymbiont of Glossina brevipalpis]|uniref:UDP-2,3-diacylglucosamine hydrolase n=1 Tax=Wigglesworthia glossinidia brevipalpis TaxID=36870 RepID=LPXH_WIGBR|nr:RecName: Full=UDP-2,3-diacylglucosamine hydrolase; AltName: Full=UDP-2,3-diacylglucosamine diphosphatase [Wigglesworthia glossinidia endosymbiont of Glossina brevipalpis]BAC24390.1 ybbF [Wigglesworthia glossinidia endosymbiont of Glossina brevipalpis]